ncbi:MurR/RpiR family transcriptional regulator [Xylocopilactobacillus apis]|uniref:HTH rpiR-type domain-containing protein n=1 Tax=Xylocopilactobacillus apis TaxID=2932183 RepID=A0AAU9DPI7_9LACO|nr:MurR/RpiR family transcriptional regulator [Xylocopilactobacillus apis]BDR56948.1 hypothetical protein KIMC2_15100 [Xylocopilactobacillus apis]
MNIIESIKNHHQDFSRSEVKVENYIIEHPESVELFTITKLADEAHTSTGAVLRFCKILGYQGYKDFRFNMINYIHTIGKSKRNDDIIDEYLNIYERILNQLRNCDIHIMEQLAHDLINKNVNYILGIHYSSLPAKLLSDGLIDLGYISLFADDFMKAEHLTTNLSDSSTIVFYSIDGAKKNTAHFLSGVIDELPLNSYLITLNPQAELSKYFSNTITLPGNINSKKSIIDLQSIPIIYTEILLNLIYEKSNA